MAKRLTHAGLVCGAVVVLAVLAMPPAAAADEPGVTVQGELQRFVVDTFEGAGVELAVVVPETGAPVRVQSDDVAEIASGAVVEVDLESVGPANQQVADPDGGAGVQAAEVIEATTDLAAAATVDSVAGAVAIAALPAGTARPVSVMTATLPGQAADAVTPAVMASELTGVVAPFWADSTGGAVRFAEVAHLAAGTYSSWGSTATCTTAQILGLLDWSARAAGAYPTVGNDRHTVVYTPRLGACGFAGVAHVGQGGSAWINGTASPARADVTAHELGHTLGLGHSDSRTACPAGVDGTALECHAGAYGDAYDVMGTKVGNAGPLSGPQLDALGLLDSRSAVFGVGGETVTLAPVGGLTGTRFLRFASGGATYYVEYRGAVGRDADLATSRKGCPSGVETCTLTRYVPGVVVRRVDDLVMGSHTNLLDAGSAAAPFALEPGRSFVTADGQYEVLVESTSAAGAVVRLISGGAVTPAFSGEAAYQPLAPRRVMSFVPIGPASTYTMHVPGLPAGAVAVSLNVTATSVRQTSYVSVCAGGTPAATCRLTSALNPSAGVTTAAAVVATLGGPNHDEITVYNNAGTIQLIADVQGAYVAGSGTTGASFVSQPPERAMDRSMAPRESFTLTLANVPAGATAVAVNLTSSAPSQVSYVSACPGGQDLASCIATSTLNPTPGRDIANFAVVKLGGPRMDQIVLYNNAGTVRLIADVNGFFVQGAAAAGGAGMYQPVQPSRVMSQAVGPRTATTLTLTGAPAGATAAVINLTATATTGTTYVSACPAGIALTDCTSTSAFNPAPWVDTSNMVVVALGGAGNDQVTLYNNAGSTRLIADVQGYFVP